MRWMRLRWLQLRWMRLRWLQLRWLAVICCRHWLAVAGGKQEGRLRAPFLLFSAFQASRQAPLPLSEGVRCRTSCNLLLGSILTYLNLQVRAFYCSRVVGGDSRFATFPTFPTPLPFLDPFFPLLPSLNPILKGFVPQDVAHSRPRQGEPRQNRATAE